MTPPARPLKVAIIYGTRPEAIKLAPLIQRMARQPERFAPLSIVTAQHREMLDQVLELFSIKPEYDLDIIKPRQTLAEITSRAIVGLDGILAKEKPDVVVVQGDTSTTFVGALAAFYHKIPVAYVESGLRTQDKYSPFPEEMNRRLTTVVGDAHFAPTKESEKCLLAEGIPQSKVWVTGNTVIDALQDVLAWGKPCEHPVLKQIEGQRMIFVTSHRRENQGAPQAQICDALLELVQKFPDVVVVFPVHLSPAVRDTVFPKLQGKERVILLDPTDYVETIHFLKASHLVMTDSGGIQEEAPSLGKPVLVLRESTERPEGITAGTSKLVGTDRARIVAEVSELLSNPAAYRKMAETANPFGDGQACDRILDLIEQNLTRP